MKCTFCAAEDGFDSMTMSQLEGLLQHFKKNGGRGVIFGGGEPTTWKEGLHQACKRAKDLGLHVQIGTNGVTLPRWFVNSDDVDRFILPLESVHSSSHNKMRKYRNGHLETVLSRLGTLCEAGKELTISTVVTPSNLWRHL